MLRLFTYFLHNMEILTLGQSLRIRVCMCVWINTGSGCMAVCIHILGGTGGTFRKTGCISVPGKFPRL